MWFYLGSYQPGEYRTYWRDGQALSASDRVRPRLPTPPWLCALLEQSQEGREALRAAQGDCRYADFVGKSHDKGVHVHALIRGSPGQALGSIFTVPSREEELLMDFMGYPADGYSLRAETVKPFSSVAKVFSQAEGLPPISLARSCFLPGGDLRRQHGDDGRLWPT